MKKLTRRAALIGGAAATTWAGYGATEAANRFGFSQLTMSRLRDLLDGDLVLPSDPGFEIARRAVSHNPITSSRPAAIVYCQSTADVARSIEFARGENLDLAARSGGCDILGRSSCDRGLVIDLSLMNQVRLSTNGQRAEVGAGASAALVNADLAASGLAIPLGCDPMVGVGGLTLGGGLGWLLGKYGTASDHLRSAELVDAQGNIHTASEAENRDLFWGLNGGGGNFGIVTRMEYETRAVSSVIGGYLVYSLDVAEELLQAYPELMLNAPPELMVEIAAIDTARGPVLVAMTCFCGPAHEAEAALAPLRAFSRPIADDVGEREYQVVGVPSPDMISAFPAPQAVESVQSGEVGDNFNHWRGCNLVSITHQAATVIVDAMRNAPPGSSFGLGHFMKGAALQPTADQTAMPRLPGSMCAYFTSSWTFARDASNRMAWVDAANNALAGQSDTPTYVNYLSSRRQCDIRRTYGPNYERLATLKANWDPENVFRNAPNIQPA